MRSNINFLLLTVRKFSMLEGFENFNALKMVINNEEETLFHRKFSYVGVSKLVITQNFIDSMF